MSQERRTLTVIDLNSEIHSFSCWLFIPNNIGGGKWSGWRVIWSRGAIEPLDIDSNGSWSGCNEMFYPRAYCICGLPSAPLIGKGLSPTFSDAPPTI